MAITFFDHTKINGREELDIITSRVDAEEDVAEFFSIKGRMYCSCRVITHAMSVGLKPLYYVGLFTLFKLNSCLYTQMLDGETIERMAAGLEHTEALVLRQLVANPALVDRFERYSGNILNAALVSPLSQLCQCVKALTGIIHPGAYYKNDPFISLFRFLASYAKKLGISCELQDCFENGSVIIHEKLEFCASSKYYYIAFEQDLRKIVSILRKIDTGEIVDIPRERVLTVLSMLDPHGDKSGLLGCAPALGRILGVICDQLIMPNEPIEAILHIANRLKAEVLTLMVLVADNSKDNSNEWQKVLMNLAHDASHRGNALILMVGKDICLSDSTMTRARRDFFAADVVKENSSKEEDEQEEEVRLAGVINEREILIKAFYEFYTTSLLMKSILGSINSSSSSNPVTSFTSTSLTTSPVLDDVESTLEGSSQGLRLVRKEIFRSLAIKGIEGKESTAAATTGMTGVVESGEGGGEGGVVMEWDMDLGLSQDPTLEAVKKYYLYGGCSVPASSDAFDDLNELAIFDFLAFATCGIEGKKNPFFIIPVIPTTPTKIVGDAEVGEKQVLLP